MNLRATGEGHISSIVFRTGVIHADQTLEFDPRPVLASGKALARPRIREWGQAMNSE